MDGKDFLLTKIDWSKEKHHMSMSQVFERYAKHAEHVVFCNLEADGEFTVSRITCGRNGLGVPSNDSTLECGLSEFGYNILVNSLT